MCVLSVIFFNLKVIKNNSTKWQNFELNWELLSNVYTMVSENHAKEGVLKMKICFSYLKP